MCPVWMPEEPPPSYHNVMCYCPPVEQDWRERVRMYRSSLGNSTNENDFTEFNDEWDSSHGLSSPMNAHDAPVRESTEKVAIQPDQAHYSNQHEKSPNDQHQTSHSNQCLTQHIDRHEALQGSQYEAHCISKPNACHIAHDSDHQHNRQDVQRGYRRHEKHINRPSQALHGSIHQSQFASQGPANNLQMFDVTQHQPQVFKCHDGQPSPGSSWYPTYLPPSDHSRHRFTETSTRFPSMDTISSRSQISRENEKWCFQATDLSRIRGASSHNSINSGFDSYSESKSPKEQLSGSPHILPKIQKGQSVTKLDQRLGKLRQQTLTSMILDGGKGYANRTEGIYEPKKKKKKNSSSTSKGKESKLKETRNRIPEDDTCAAEKDENNSPLKKISCLSEYERSHVLHHLTQAGEVAMTILYQNGSSLLRLPIDKLESLNEEVKGCVVAFSVSNPCSACREELQNMDLIYVLFSLNNVARDFVWTRNVLGDLMASKTRKISFNGQQLIKILTSTLQPDNKTVCKSWKVLDLRVAGWLLNPDSPPRSLSNLIESSELQMVETPNSDERVCKDIRLLGPAMQSVYHSLKTHDLWNLFLNVETALCPILALWELRGLRVSTKTLMYYCDMLKRKLDKLQIDAHRAAGEPFVINSHAQLRHVIFEKLKLDSFLGTKAKIARTSSGNQKSTSEAVLNQLQNFHPLPKLVLEYRQIQKLKSTYIDGMVAHVTNGCIYTHWDQTSAATGRLASTHPNIQSIPKQPLYLTDISDNDFIIGKEGQTVEVNARDAFISRQGCSFLAADFQQIEFRLFAHLANDESLIRLFNHPAGQDVFTLLTSEWLGKCYEDVTEIERDQTKRIVYSVMYGVGKERLSDYLKISATAAKGVMDSFLIKFPGVNRFTTTCKEEAKQAGFLCTIFKRRRWFPSINSPNFQMRSQSERQAVNFRVQGSAADLCKAAMIQIEQSLASRKHLQTRMLVQIHDELLFEVPDAEIDEVKDIVKTIMEDSTGLCKQMVQLKVPLKVSLKVGKSWGKMENTL